MASVQSAGSGSGSAVAFDDGGVEPEPAEEVAQGGESGFNSVQGGEMGFDPVAASRRRSGRSGAGRLYAILGAARMAA
ncbi:hypothetical protein J2853_002063 [Streptosporangium lutulentum]|uniref:Uncharacterized protein n=1 Tax=Streptosporangium lutulentum TaxID=1461250 RepID=A0ABT9Q7W9_9ACTN|nr:hypothetical protein [Streptosporangium lutulentum]